MRALQRTTAITLKIYSQWRMGLVSPPIITSVDLQSIFCIHSTHGTSLEGNGSSVWGSSAIFYKALYVGRAELNPTISTVTYLPCFSDYTIWVWEELWILHSSRHLQFPPPCIQSQWGVGITINFSLIPISRFGSCRDVPRMDVLTPCWDFTGGGQR